jgi:hypothetical protein
MKGASLSPSRRHYPHASLLPCPVCVESSAMRGGPLPLSCTYPLPACHQRRGSHDVYKSGPLLLLRAGDAGALESPSCRRAPPLDAYQIDTQCLRCCTRACSELRMCSQGPQARRGDNSSPAAGFGSRKKKAGRGDEKQREADGRRVQACSQAQEAYSPTAQAPRRPRLG